MPTIIVIFVAVAIIGLQIYLSKNTNNIGGLILPIIAFLASIVVVLNVAMIPGNGHIELVLWMFLLSNYPTLVLLVIFFVFKNGQRPPLIATLGLSVILGIIGELALAASLSIPGVFFIPAAIVAAIAFIKHIREKKDIDYE